MPTTKTDKFTIPATHRPEEFLNDADLAEYYQRQNAALADDAPGKADARRLAAHHRRSAAVTAALVETHHADTAEELAEAKKRGVDHLVIHTEREAARAKAEKARK